MLRATNDTNVWISGINWEHGKPRQLLELARAKAYAHVTGSGARPGPIEP